MKKTNKMTAYDVFSVIVAVIGSLLFGAVFVGCYVWLIMNFSLAALVATLLASLIPGLISYSIAVATVDFIRGDHYSTRRIRAYRKKSVSDGKMKEVLSLILMLLAIILFGGMAIGAFVYAFMHFSVASILAAALMAIIPGLICYACISTTVEYLKNGLSRK